MTTFQTASRLRMWPGPPHHVAVKPDTARAASAMRGSCSGARRSRPSARCASAARMVARRAYSHPGLMTPTQRDCQTHGSKSAWIPFKGSRLRFNPQSALPHLLCTAAGPWLVSTPSGPACQAKVADVAEARWQAGDAMDMDGFNGFREGHIRQDGREPACQHRLPDPWWAEHQEVMVRTPA
jgi:hypothetical protein